MIKIFNHYFHKRTLLQISFDLCLLFVLVLVCVISHIAEPAVVSAYILTMSISLAVGILIINTGLGFYQRVHHWTLTQIRFRGVISLVLSLVLAYVIFRFSHLRVEDESAFNLAMVASVGLMVAHRIYAFHALHKGGLRLRVLVYGSGLRALSVGKTLVSTDSSVDLVGYYVGLKEGETPISGRHILSADKTLTEHVAELRVDEIVVALSERRGGSMPLHELLDCKLSGVKVVDVATHFEKKLGQISRDSVSVGGLIFGEGFEQGRVRIFVKRSFDIVFSLLLILLAMPVMLLTCLLIWLESGRPFFYFQERVGLNGKPFNVIKFRSMGTDAEKDGTPVWAQAKDKRVTRLGRVIRKLRIDELPQLLCVLAGSMSLVGPRPERPFFVKKLINELAFYEVRQSVKPGVTGWAQVRYHYGASVEDAAEKLQYDLFYVKNNSLFLDLLVLFETVGVVVTGKGAH